MAYEASSAKTNKYFRKLDRGNLGPRLLLTSLYKGRRVVIAPLNLFLFSAPLSRQWVLMRPGVFLGWVY